LGALRNRLALIKQSLVSVGVPFISSLVLEKIMSEFSTQVANRINWARFVLSSARKDGSEVEDALREEYKGFAGFIVGLFAALFAVLAARLTRVTDAMRGKELALSEELVDDDPVRDARDERTAELRETLFSARHSIEGGFGESQSIGYGLADMPPNHPDKLVPFAENAINLLRQTPRSAADMFGNIINTTKIAEVIEKSCDALIEALKAVDGETREAHHARVRRDESVEEWRRVYRGTAEILSGLYLLAGREDLANRVRPTVRSAEGKDEAPEFDAELVDGSVDEAPVEA
jgi:hypothetical protein